MNKRIRHLSAAEYMKGNKMPNKCKKCGNKDNYNFALNIGLCNSCIAAELERAENAVLKRGIIDDKDIEVVLVPKKLYDQLEAKNKRLRKALETYGRHGGAYGSPICESSKHSDYPCTCGFEQALKDNQ